MSEASEGSGSGPAHRGVEMGVAVITGLFGILIMVGSLQVGINWGVEGPKSGFFPFYVGLIILGCSIIILAQSALASRSDKLFAEWSQLRSVLSVVIPTAVYVFVLPSLGIYISSTILIAGFMMWLGSYRAPAALAVALSVPIVTFFMFEKWFLVPLPKSMWMNTLGF